MTCMSRIRNCTVHSRSRQISTAQKRYKGTQREGRAEMLIDISATKIPSFTLYQLFKNANRNFHFHRFNGWKRFAVDISETLLAVKLFDTNIM